MTLNIVQMECLNWYFYDLEELLIMIGLYDICINWMNGFT